MISDPEEVKNILDTSENASNAVDAITSSNFFLGLILGGSMESLWGMVRAIQLISLSSIVEVPTPIHMFTFMTVCITLS